MAQTYINPCSSPLRLHGQSVIPLPTHAFTPLHAQRAQQQYRAYRCTHVVTATAATDAPTKKQQGAKKKRDHPDVPNLPMVQYTRCPCTQRILRTRCRSPQPKAFQQTVKASFSIMGIGLHTADTGTALQCCVTKDCNTVLVAVFANVIIVSRRCCVTQLLFHDTGFTAVVRVRPALAGEGRYFVRVPEGTNRWRVQMEELDEYEEDEWVEKRTFG